MVSFTLHCGVIFVPNNPPLNQPQLLPNHALPTPVQIEKLRPLLCGYDAALTSNLCDGFTFGFPLHFKGDRISFFATNLISAQQHLEIVSAKIPKELAAGRLAGPFDSPPFPNFRVSPLGVVPKKAPGEYRFIHHLLFSRDASVNDGISTEDTSV